MVPPFVDSYLSTHTELLNTGRGFGISAHELHNDYLRFLKMLEVDKDDELSLASAFDHFESYVCIPMVIINSLAMEADLYRRI